VADHPEVVRAKEKLKTLVVPAVDVLEELSQSEHAGIRLGAVREILDRGGVPARQEQHLSIDLTMDEEIEQLVSAVRRQVTGARAAADASIEDAILIEEEEARERPIGELAAETIGVPPQVPTPSEPEEEVAWWQANEVG